MPSVKRLFPAGSAAVILGCGPSLTAADVEAIRGRAHVVAVNDSYRLAEWADAMWACDAKWWRHHQGAPTFRGVKYGLAAKNETGWPGVQLLTNTGETGLELEPSGVRIGLRGGSNSGVQAINLAVHLGASRILLLGYDMKPARNGRTHFFGHHPTPLKVSSPYGHFVRSFDSLVDPLKALGIQVINCSRDTALECFPRMSLAVALEQVAA